MFFVLGSGPASIACAMALVKRGRLVTILDAGKTLEPDRQAVLDRLSRQEPEAWDPSDLEELRTDHKARHGKIHSKLSYGSDFPYADAGEPLLQDRDRSAFNYSMARGGLSTVWGAALAPYCAKDIADWPIGVDDLAPHYRAVLRFVSSTGEIDDLDQLLPMYTDHLDPLRPSRQSVAFLEDLQRHRERLKRSGILFGTSRLALAASGDANRHSCVYCGLCLYGCPYSLIYSSAITLDELLETGNVTYINDHVVEKLAQSDGHVTIHARRVAQGDVVTFEADRVFVGCGVLPTTYIMLNSLGAYDTPVEIIDSQYFIYPFLRFKRIRSIENEKTYAASQIYIDIDAPNLSPHLIHLEAYGYSEFVMRAMMETPLRFFLRNRWIADQMFGRLFILQCFLHSNDSSRLVAELHHEPGAARPSLRVSPRAVRRAFWTSLRAGLKLSAHALRLGGAPILPALQFAGPGRSYHSGGTFPMRANPSRFETDTLGRLPGMDRVHLVDSSVFPSIPATTITLTVMANAHRIASEADEL